MAYFLQGLNHLKQIFFKCPLLKGCKIGRTGKRVEGTRVLGSGIEPRTAVASVESEWGAPSAPTTPQDQ